MRCLVNCTLIVPQHLTSRRYITTSSSSAAATGEQSIDSLIHVINFNYYDADNACFVPTTFKNIRYCLISAVGDAYYAGTNAITIANKGKVGNGSVETDDWPNKS